MTENQDIWNTGLFYQDYVHHKLQVSKYTAIKQLISSYLQETLSIYTTTEKSGRTNNSKIPLHKGRDDKKILYISGMALWLSKSQNQQPMEIANAIASRLLATCGDVFSVKIVPPGWIHFQLTDFALATWLQNVAVGNRGGEDERKNIFNRKSTADDGADLFSVQYAHARCCSLLLLAHRERLIKLQEPLPTTSPSVWHVIFPNPIPWLNSDLKLHLNHAAETRLISRLVEVVDDLVESKAAEILVNWKKTAQDLSQAFENFWRNCRIWGEVRITSPELAQARLGLVMATQSVLKFLLEEKLGLFACWEL
ncbi:DALR anticodon-binding domain-containing protein [Fortiea contorta]|uniref:DALR anticodon-binding domain-containing protein n=1 Tax=Fortiea contorta TaxID=1892405 RepID=UPI000348CB6A|nr:DALR anticodon-binding domain-containing protein [Fortiea contorta]